VNIFHHRIIKRTVVVSMSLFGEASNGHEDVRTDGTRLKETFNIVKTRTIPTIYSKLFNEASPVHGTVHLAALDHVLLRSDLGESTQQAVRNRVSQNGTVRTLDRDEWNCAMFLIGISQRGITDFDQIQYYSDSK
jgi:hypothetical protein